MPTLVRIPDRSAEAGDGAMGCALGDQYACCQYLRIRSAAGRRACAAERFREPLKRERPAVVVKKDQSHEQQQSADHRDKQICIAGVDRVAGLLMDDPCKGSKRQDLEEDKSGHQIRREHDALHGAERKQDEEAVAADILSLVGKVFQAEQGRCRPHERRDHRVDRTEAIYREGKSA